MINQIDLRLLRSFIVLAKSAGYVKAAETLNVSQSALSQQMRDLTIALGQSIFEKTGRKSVLTSFGKELLNRVEPIVGNLDEALLMLKNNSSKSVGVLNIGATNTYLKAIAIPVCMDMFTNNPELKITLNAGSAQNLIDALNEGVIDLGILPDNYQTQNLQHQFLFREHFSLIGKKIKLKKFPNKINLKMLEKEELVLLNKNFLMRQKIDFQCKSDGVSLKNRLEVSSMDDLIEIVKTGKILAIGSSIACHGEKDLVGLEIEGDHLSRDATIYWRKGAHQTTAMKSFIESAIKKSNTFY